MKISTLLASVALATGLIFSSNAVMSETEHSNDSQLFAQSQQQSSPEEFIDSLNLSDEQRERIQEILDSYRPEVRSTSEELRQELQNLIDTTVPTASADEIRIARQEVIHVRQELSNLLFEELMAIRSELTIEQREQINQRLRDLYDRLN